MPVESMIEVLSIYIQQADSDHIMAMLATVGRLKTEAKFTP
jgi:hypothetical protein